MTCIALFLFSLMALAMFTVRERAARMRRVVVRSRPQIPSEPIARYRRR